MMWSPAMDARLAALKASRLGWEEIASRLGVTVEAAHCRARRIGLARIPDPTPPVLAPLSPDERAKVEAAVLRLRRRGMVVHAERVSDRSTAPTGRWVVGRRRLDLAGLLSAAERCA
jgi:hypothetical protein